MEKPHTLMNPIYTYVSAYLRLKQAYNYNTIVYHQHQASSSLLVHIHLLNSIQFPFKCNNISSNPGSSNREELLWFYALVLRQVVGVSRGCLL